MSTTSTRSEPYAIAIGFLVTAGGMLGLLAASAITLPAMAAGVGLVAMGADARQLWKVRGAAVGGAMFGGIGTMVGVVMGSPTPLLAVPVAAGAAAGMAALLRWRDRRRLARLVIAHARGAPLEPHLDDLITSPRPVVFETAVLLASWGRFDLLERLGTYAMVPGNDSLRRFHLAVARLGRGDPDSAAAIAASADHDANGPLMAEEWFLLLARIRIALGEGAAVIASMRGSPDDATPLAITRRRLVLADAHAATGDLATARGLVGQVAAGPSGRDVLLALRASGRPTSAIAADLLAAAGPYR